MFSKWNIIMEFWSKSFEGNCPSPNLNWENSPCFHSKFWHKPHCTLIALHIFQKLATVVTFTLHLKFSLIWIKVSQMCSARCLTHKWAVALTLCVLTTSDVGWFRLYKCTLQLYSCTPQYICPGLTLNITQYSPRVWTSLTDVRFAE